MNATEPRLEPLKAVELTDEMRELLALPNEHRREDVPEFLATLLRHPGLYRHYAAFAGKLLLKGKLPPRDRELAILRGGWLCNAPFEWGEHVAIAKSIGISSEEIERITRGSDDRAWNEHERAVIKSVEELHSGGIISDATWAVLARSYSDAQLIEFPMLIGNYQMIAYVQNSLRVRLREGNPGLTAR